MVGLELLLTIGSHGEGLTLLLLVHIQRIGIAIVVLLWGKLDHVPASVCLQILDDDGFK
jgi:hypothetical protein